MVKTFLYYLKTNIFIQHLHYDHYSISKEKMPIDFSLTFCSNTSFTWSKYLQYARWVIYVSKRSSEKKSIDWAHNVNGISDISDTENQQIHLKEPIVHISYASFAVYISQMKNWLKVKVLVSVNGEAKSVAKDLNLYSSIPILFSLPSIYTFHLIPFSLYHRIIKWPGSKRTVMII